MIARQTLTVLLISIITGTASAADPSALDLLTSMQTAGEKLNYHGTLIYIQDGQAQSMRIVHKIDDDGEFERVVSLNGSLREVIRSNDVVSCFLPDANAVTISRGQFAGDVLSKVAANDFGVLQNYYEFQRESTGRVAGLEAKIIRIKPKDEFRYGYRLWLEKQTDLLLKSDLLNRDDNVLEQAMFADVSIVNYIPQEMLKPSIAGEGLEHFEHDNSMVDAAEFKTDWRLGDIPAGFEVKKLGRRSFEGDDQSVEHWVVSDGLASVSIYIEKLVDDSEKFDGASQLGAMNIYGRSLDGYQITVIGDVPTVTAKNIAQSMSASPMNGND